MLFIHRLFLLSMCVVALLAFKPPGSVCSKAAIMCFFIHCLFLLSMCVVALLAFKPAGSVRSKATIMCCLFIICFCFQCVLLYCLVSFFFGMCLGDHSSLANILLRKRYLVALR